MITINLHLPKSLHTMVIQLAKEEGISINQFIASATAEKMSAFMTRDYLAERAKRGDRAKFDAVLAKVPRTPPDEDDRWE